MTHYEIQKYLLSAESFAGYFLQNTSYEKFIPKKFTYKLEKNPQKQQRNKQQQKIPDMFTSVWNYAQTQNNPHQSRAQEINRER